MLSSLLLVLCADPLPLSTRIEDVTVYGSTALVHRAVAIERGGSYVIRGLPAALDERNVRVRCTGGDVVRVEVQSRLVSSVPSERLQALRERLTALQRDLAVLQDEEAVLRGLREGLDHLRKLDAQNHARDVAAGSGNAEAWRTSFAFLAQRTGELTRAQRELGWRIEDQRKALQAAENEVGLAQGAPTVRLHDVLVDVVAAGNGTLDVEYFVAGTGWTPAYDVRATKELTEVALTYRARVWQQTGEDWSDVALVLSTAQPQRGAQGPEPVTAWVDVLRPVAEDGYAAARRPTPGTVAAPAELRAELGEAQAGPAPRPFAAVENLGLSARFQLPAKETIQSRETPTTVLVGETRFPISPERFCTPALDTTVWLRAKTKNATAWPLLPGVAAVFLGADYLGQSRLETVQVGQEFTLHLGADPAVTVTRTQVEDLSKGPTFLSNRAAKLDAWRTRLENHGAAAARQDGSVDVFVRDVLPKTKDDRIEIEFTKTSAKWSEDARWKEDREEHGIHTWVLRVPKGGHADLVLQTTITYPKGEELVRD